MTEKELLADCLRRLNRAGGPYMLTGSMAGNYWGIPRTTHDLDFVVQLPDRQTPAFALYAHVSHGRIQPRSWARHDSSTGTMTLSTQDRKKVIAIAARRMRPGSGSSQAMLREQGGEYRTVDVRRLLGATPFVIVGGVATRLYMPARMTLDTDVLIHPRDLDRAEDALTRSRCRRMGPLAIGGSSWRLASGRSLDLIALNEPWVEAALGHFVPGDDGLPYIALPYLVLMKLAAGRMQDLADISRMLGSASEEALRATRRIIARYRSRDAEDLESLLALGRQEHVTVPQPPIRGRERSPRRRGPAPPARSAG